MTAYKRAAPDRSGSLRRRELRPAGREEKREEGRRGEEREGGKKIKEKEEKKEEVIFLSYI